MSLILPNQYARYILKIAIIPESGYPIPISWGNEIFACRTKQLSAFPFTSQFVLKKLILRLS